MDELLPIIGSKLREVMECEAVNLWLLQPDESLELMHQAGFDPTTRAGSRQRPGEGVGGDVSDNGEAVLIRRARECTRHKAKPLAPRGAVASSPVQPLMCHT